MSPLPRSRMSPVELRSSMSLAGIFGIRMLGLFLILPVFAAHASKLAGGENLTLVGLALGAYGLTQAVLQIPFGIASDRWGRKRLIVIGLLIFAAGSFVAAAATDIWTAIAGRSIQGAGAISSVVVALAADLTREEHRTKAMAMVGAMIGLSFALSLVGAPVLYGIIGMPGLFIMTGGLAFAAIWMIKALVPDVPIKPRPEAASLALVGRELAHPELLRLNLGIFVLHVGQMAMFVVVPVLLVEAGSPLATHWMLYLPVVLASFALMVPPVLYVDRSNRPRPVLLCAVVLLLVVQLLFVFGPAASSIAGLGALLLGFFVAFNVLEAMLPSLVSKVAPERVRGTAIGVYNTTQTLGLFFGGLLGGWIAGFAGSRGVFALCAVLSLIWLIAAAGMRSPVAGTVNRLAPLTFSIPSGVETHGLREALAGLQGVHKAEVLESERLVRVTVGPGDWDETGVRRLLKGGE